MARNCLSSSAAPSLLAQRLSPYLQAFASRRIAAMLWLGFASGLPLALSAGTLQAWLTVAGVDLGTIGIGLTQQIAGPFVFSGGIGYNIDPNSSGYGNVTGSYLEFRWQRRAYDIGLYYSPYQGIGGIRIRLNDFNFRGTGVPYVPYDPARAVLDRPF